jgi:peroxiredoxin Q/BCP
MPEVTGPYMMPNCREWSLVSGKTQERSGTMGQLKEGDKAPGFTLMNQNGKTVKLSDFKGRKLLLYFYPKANTSGCTQQARSVSDALSQLSKREVAVAGISPDKPGDQKKFDEKNGLGFPLLSDPDHSIADEYGAWGEKSMYGKKYEGVIRSAYLIDKKGKIEQTWYKISPKDTVPKAIQALTE